MYKEKKKNLIILVAFASVVTFFLGSALVQDRISNDRFIATKVLASDSDASKETVTVENEVVAADNEVASFSVTKYETPVTMYASETVNVRSGAGTEYDKVGKLAFGNTVTATGETDNGWYEVIYNDAQAYIMGDYMSAEVPSVPYLFVGDSRTVQMELAVGSTDKAFIAKIGEGYNWFKNTALSEIPTVAGNGTTMIINFGVNDLGNVRKYIDLVNSNIDSWLAQGITVYYSSVTPVGNCSTVTNEQIENFNAKMQEGLDPRVNWIDSYSYLQQVGFSTSDGLHYSKDTYRTLYAYYMSVIENG